MLQTDDVIELVRRHGRSLTLEAIRLALEEMRTQLKEHPDLGVPEIPAILSRTQAHLEQWERSSLQTVINATGVILHTNLGRAPLSAATIAAMRTAAGSYSNLEFDLETGKRGSRLVHAEALLQRLLKIEAAVVVNNNASAVLLILAAMAARKSVVIARSQLVEIGGGFRIPDVMRQSGAKLVEVGTTNKVRTSDYEEALGAGAGLVMRVHRSNFRMVGFTEEPSLQEIVEAAHAAGRSLVDDLGSGALLDTARFGLGHEPTAQESIAAGADLICFSGDKLLGGPQAGIIIGKAELVEKIRKHPLARAVRADKASLAGIGATLLHYLRGEAEIEIPVWRMISTPVEEIQRRARAWAAELGTGSVMPSTSTVGGGSLPGETLPTYVLALEAHRADQLAANLRVNNPPIVARTENNRVLVDPRTVLADQDRDLLKGLRLALKAQGQA